MFTSPLKDRGGLFKVIGIVLVLVIIAVSYYATHIRFVGLIINNPATTTTTTASTTTGTTVTTPPLRKTSVTQNISHKEATVVTIAESMSDASQFISLFKSTGVAAQITGKGPYTIFVPTNGAFGQLPPGTITKMTDAQKLRFIQYHVIAGRAIDPQAQTAGTIQAFSGDALNFSYGPDKIPLVNSAIFLKKYEASNGVVYQIDNVLLPPQR